MTQRKNIMIILINKKRLMKNIVMMNTTKIMMNMMNTIKKSNKVNTNIFTYKTEFHTN
jgi:hypothetical protein